MPQEVVLTTSPSGDSSILLHDLHNSSHVQTFRQCATTKGGVTLTNSKSEFLAAQLDKGVVHVYSWGKDSVGIKMILPEKIRCLQMSPSATWCVGGSDSGKLFLWEVPCVDGNYLMDRLRVGICFSREKRIINLLRTHVSAPMKHFSSLAAMMLSFTYGEYWIWWTSTCEVRKLCQYSHGTSILSPLQELSVEVALQ